MATAAKKIDKKAPKVIATTGLYHSSDEQPGWSRRRWGRGFQYFDESQQKIRNKIWLKRIKALVIPPSWTDVWICKDGDGHLQVTGRDVKRRKQYIYHADWTDFRQMRKFSKLYGFAEKLPTIRQNNERLLRHSEWSKLKVLALAVTIMDQYHIRVGNQQYYQRNGTHGLTTLRRKHMDITSDGLRLGYTAKKGKFRKITILNKRLIKLIKSCSELPGYELFRYQLGSRSYDPLDSQDVNQYIQNVMGEAYSAKDFRTWSGTSLAVRYLDHAKSIISDHPTRKLAPTLVKLVAKELGNTMSICKEYYIHPRVLELAETDQIPPIKVYNDPWLDDYECVTRDILALLEQ